MNAMFTSLGIAMPGRLAQNATLETLGKGLFIRSLIL